MKDPSSAELSLWIYRLIERSVREKSNLERSVAENASGKNVAGKNVEKNVVGSQTEKSEEIEMKGAGIVTMKSAKEKSVKDQDL